MQNFHTHTYTYTLYTLDLAFIPDFLRIVSSKQYGTQFQHCADVQYCKIKTSVLKYWQIHIHCCTKYTFKYKILVYFSAFSHRHLKDTVILNLCMVYYSQQCSCVILTQAQKNKLFFFNLGCFFYYQQRKIPFD